MSFKVKSPVRRIIIIKDTTTLKVSCAIILNMASSTATVVTTVDINLAKPNSVHGTILQKAGKKNKGDTDVSFVES